MALCEYSHSTSYIVNLSYRLSSFFHADPGECHICRVTSFPGDLFVKIIDILT